MKKKIEKFLSSSSVMVIKNLLENIWCGIYSSSDDIHTYIGQDTHAYMRLTYMYM